MNFLKTNWKTTLFGVLTIISALAPIWAPAEIAHKIQATTAVFTGSGLIFSKDANISK